MAMNDFIIGLILLPPFIGALLTWFSDSIRRKSSRMLGVISTGISAITAVIGFFMFHFEAWEPSAWKFTSWFDFSNPIIISISPDALGIFMTLVAAFLGFLIALFSLEYMAEDAHLTRYWFYIQLFIGGMILLVLAGDLILLYVGWEIVGLCSYGLISHWRNLPSEQGKKAGLSGLKAFIFTRIGDIGFLVAIVLIYQKFGSVDFETIAAGSSGLSDIFLSNVSILFLMAAFGKSAQIPFIPWLSSPESVDIDAMQGPTTVSALIHAATMVKAGVYLISRVFLLLPLWKLEIFLWLFLSIAGLTALIAALSALVSFDLKRILAFSTVSQLAYMFMGLSLAFVSLAAEDTHLADTAFLSTQFHLISHAIFKSLLFLSAGYLIHSIGSRDVRELTGTASWENDKIAFVAFLVGGLGLAGVPPLNGYFSKEALIGTAYAGIELNEYSQMFIWIYVFSVVTAVITAIYVTRMFYYLFLGEVKTSKEDHHVPNIMPAVMVVLSALVILGGLFQLLLPSFFEPVIGEAEFHSLIGEEIINTIILTLLVLITIGVTWYVYNKDNLVSGISSIFLINWISEAAKAGFYLEDLWMGGLYIIKRGSYGFRKTHSGNINDMILLSMITGLGIIAYIIGGGL